MKPSQNRTTIFKLIVHGIELHVAFEERDIKKKNAKFSLKSVMQFYEKRKITQNYTLFININGSCQCLKIKTYMSDFSSVYCSILSKMVCIFLDDFL